MFKSDDFYCLAHDSRIAVGMYKHGLLDDWLNLPSSHLFHCGVPGLLVGRSGIFPVGAVF